MGGVVQVLDEGDSLFMFNSLEVDLPRIRVELRVRILLAVLDN